MMNLLHWRLLVAVADMGNISRAAERVGMTQSGASQAIAQLEATLGVQVFVRERRQVAVTAMGEQVLRHAREMLAQLEAIRSLVDEHSGLSQGRIRLASFPSVISTLLPGLLKGFQRRYPGTELVALEGTDEEVEAWLADDTVDLGVVLNPAPERAAVSLGRDRWLAVVPGDHPLGRRSSEVGVALAELVHEPFILATGGCAVNGASLMARAGHTLSNVRVTVRDLGSACVLVREGLGVALLPESALPSDRQGLRVLQLKEQVYREFGLVASAAGAASPLVALFLAHVRALSEVGNR